MNKKITQAFKDAFNGLNRAIKEERNFRIHLILALIAVIVGYYLNLSSMEWLFVALSIVLVLTLEIVNSIFERVLDIVKPSINQYVKEMKDMMAAGVLLTAIFALIVFAVIYLPKLTP